VGVAWNFFHPYKVLKYICHFLIFFFWISTPKDTAEASAVDLFRLNTQGGTKTTFLTPQRYNKHPCPFLHESPCQLKRLPLRNFHESTLMEMFSLIILVLVGHILLSLNRLHCPIKMQHPKVPYTIATHQTYTNRWLTLQWNQI